MMNLSSVGNTYSQTQTQAAQRLPESAEVQKTGGDNDGDADDGGASSTQAQLSATVNLSGQKIGQQINVSA